MPFIFGIFFQTYARTYGNIFDYTTKGGKIKGGKIKGRKNKMNKILDKCRL